MLRVPHGERSRPAGLPAKRVERKKERTRRLLKEVALALFFEKGLYWTTVEDITDRADVGKGTFYHYFPTKEALILTLLQDGHQQVLARVRDEAGLAKPGAQGVSAVASTLADFYLEHPDLLLLFHQIRGFLLLKTAAAKELHDAYARHLEELGAAAKRVLPDRATTMSHRRLGIVFSAVPSGLVTDHLLFDRDGDSKKRKDSLRHEIERGVNALVFGRTP